MNDEIPKLTDSDLVGAYEPVNIQVSDMYTLALALDAERKNMEKMADVAMRKLSPEADAVSSESGPRAEGDGSVQVPADEGPEPLGTDKEYIGVAGITQWHTDARAQARLTLAALKVGIDRLSTITNAIVSEFQSQDELNAASVDQVGDLTGVYPPGHEKYSDPADRDFDEEVVRAAYNDNRGSGGGGNKQIAI